jgi:hypothetical protein
VGAFFLFQAFNAIFADVALFHLGFFFVFFFVALCFFYWCQIKGISFYYAKEMNFQIVVTPTA